LLLEVPHQTAIDQHGAAVPFSFALNEFLLLQLLSVAGSTL
jgi:hypothetical protein